AVLLQRRLRLGCVVGRGTRVLDAEQSEQRALQRLGELDRRPRLSLGELLRLGNDAAAVAVGGGVDAAERAYGQVRLASARAVTDGADLAVQVGQLAQVVD